MDKAVTELKANLVKSRKAVEVLRAKKREIYLSAKKEMKGLFEQITAEKKVIAEVLKQISVLKYGDREKTGRPTKKKDRSG
jgi:hypothetical protein